MATYEEVINGNINSLKELKDLVKSFKDELATAKEGSEEWENAVEGLSVAQERLDKINKAAKGTLEGYNDSAKDSINTLKARIKELNTERNAMDMNSAEYAEATAQLKEMNTRLRESGVAAGDMKANVGNYAESLAAGFNGIKDAVGQASSQMISAIGGLGQSLGGLSPTLATVTTGMQGLTAATGAVGIALAAIAAVLAAFKEGVQSSESNTNKFKEALIPVQAILILIQRAIQEATSKVLDWMIALQKNEKLINVFKIAIQAIYTAFDVFKKRIKDVTTVLVGWYNKIKEIASKIADVFKPVVDAVDKVFDVTKNKLEPVIKWIIDKWNWLAKTDVGKLLGLNIIKDTAEAWKENKQAAEDTITKVSDLSGELRDNLQKEIDLQSARRNLLLANARLNGEIAQKELEINEERSKEVKDYDKILGLINEKTALQVQQAKNNIALKAAELAAIKQRNALSDTSVKDMDAEYAAEAALIEAQNALTQAEAQGAAEERKILQEKFAKERTTAMNALAAALKNFESEYTNALAAIEKPLAPEGAEIDADSINAYHDQMMANYQAEYEAYSSMTEQKIAVLELFIEQQKALGYDTVAQESEIAKLRAANAKKYKEMIDAQNKDDKERTKALRSNYNAQLGAFSNLMGSMSSLFEQNTVAYKATATAKALLDTYMAANAVLAQQTGGYIARAAAMAATIATGIANVIAIWRTDTKNPSVSTSTQAAATSVPTVDETPYSYAQTVQTVAAEETLNQGNEPLQVYVLESDITNAQNKAKVRVAESSW